MLNLVLKARDAMLTGGTATISTRNLHLKRGDPVPDLQRLPRAGLGDAGRHRRTAHSQAAQGRYFPGFLEPRRTGREGADRGHPGSLYPGHLDPLGR